MTDFDISLRFLLDAAAQARVEKGVSTLAEELAKVGVSMDDIKGAKFGEAVAAEVDKATKATKEKLNPALKETKDAIKQARAEAALLSKQAAEIASNIKQAQISGLRSTAGFVEGIGRGALIGGTALSGGIFLAAKNYIKDAEQSDRLTRQWAASTKEIEKAQERIGRIAAQAVLPTLEKAADIAEKVAGFVEQHPEIVQAAFNTGLFVAGFGALAIAVSKGIKLSADLAYLATIPTQLTAAKLQDAAANKQLAAAQLRLKDLGVPVPSKAGSLLPAAGAIGGTIAANVAATVFIAKQLDELDKVLITKFGGIAKNVSTVIETGLFPIVPALRPIRDIQRQLPQIEEFIKKILGIGDAAKKASDEISLTGLSGSVHESEIVGAFEKWKEDDARIVSEAAEQRVKIMANAEKAVSVETARNAARVASINTAAAKRAEAISSNFLKADTKAETSYQEQRAKIIRDGGKEVRRIEDDHQERLRKLTLEHSERVEDLTASRDALGLAKEARRFNQAKAEENRSTREEIAKRREDLAVRLQELDRENQVEQAQRLAQFQQALQENEAQRKEELKQAAIAHTEELKQIRAAKAQQLRELQESLNAERIRRREVFIAQVRDLDASLLGERGLKQRRYAEMLTDVDKFLQEYRKKLSTMPVGGAGFASGGYASGPIVTGEQGYEFVMSHRATRAAEKIIGGGLTQDAMLNALVRGAANGGSRTITLNDQRRINASVPLSERRALVRDTVEAIRQEFGR